MDWRLSVLDLPGGTVAYYLLQRYVTRTWPRPATTLKALQDHACRVVEDYSRHVGGTPSLLLEVGAGRDLAVPLALRRLGVAKVLTSDTERLARLDLVQHAAAHILAGALSLDSWESLERFGILYRAPHYVTEAGEKADCSYSNEVLEHVPPDQLVRLLAGLRAVTTSLTTNSIDYSDHYPRSDAGLSRLTFLQYDDSQWRPFNSRRQYVNRLRHSDYVRMFRDAGFTILEESSTPGEPTRDITNNIAPLFRKYEPADLFALKGRIVAR